MTDERHAMSVEEIRAANVGEPTRIDGPIDLAEPDPTWPALFAREAERIRHALGDDAIAIEHVGSTSVPGLAAKPIIDILLVLADPADEISYVPLLEAVGYILRIREPEWYEHRMFRGPDTDVNLHVLPAGCVEIERMLAFRDHLRTNAADRDRYERAKRELASRTWEFGQNYADAKTEIVEDILTRALAERR